MQLNWSQIDTVLLDMDGTLLDLHFDTHFWVEHMPMRYAQIHNCDVTEVRQWLMQRLRKERGTIDWYCVDYWSDQLKLDIRQLKYEVRHNIGYLPFAERFLQLLKEAPQKVILVTNDHRSSLEMKLELTSLEQYLDAIIVSHDYRVAKEQQAFWQQLQNEQPFDPLRTLFIDDTVAILDAAHDFGIEHLRLMAQPNTRQRRDIDTKHLSIECYSTINSALNIKPESVASM